MITTIQSKKKLWKTTFVSSMIIIIKIIKLCFVQFNTLEKRPTFLYSVTIFI